MLDSAYLISKHFCLEANLIVLNPSMQHRLEDIIAGNNASYYRYVVSP